MKFCSKCGKELFDEAVICPACGCPQKGYNTNQTKDSKNILWFILSFLYFWVGIILYFVWKDTAPSKAKLCITGSVSAIVVSVLILIVMGIIRLFT